MLLRYVFSMFIIAGCSQTKTKSDPSKTLCPEGQDCRPSASSLKAKSITPIEVSVDVQHLWVNGQEVTKMTCVSPMNAQCTQENVTQGRSYVQIANRPSTAKLTAISELSAEVNKGLKSGQGQASTNAQQRLKVHPALSYHLFYEVLMSVTDGGVTHPMLTLLQESADKGRPVVRISDGAKPKERPELPLNLAVSVARDHVKFMIYKAHRRHFDMKWFQPIKGEKQLSLLVDRLAAIKARFPGESKVNLAADPEVAMGRVVSVIDTVRTHFPALKLVPGPSHQWINRINKKVKDQLKTMRDSLPPKKDGP